LDTRSEEAVENCENGDSCDGGDGDPNEEKHASKEHDGDEGIDGAEQPICYQSWNEAARDADAIYKKDQIERCSLRDVEDVPGERSDVEIRHPHSYEAEEHAGIVEEIERFCERFPFDQRASVLAAGFRFGER